jgi:hypothetical protein
MTDNYSRQQINTKQDHAKEQTFIMGGQGCETPGDCRFWDYKLNKNVFTSFRAEWRNELLIWLISLLNG